MKVLTKNIELKCILKWCAVIAIVGIAVGSVSALFLYTLDIVTSYRIQHFNIIYFLPFAGLIIGLLYHYFGREIITGNNLVIEEYYQPQKTIPFLMAPMIYITTILTHLFGGSAGREGTAIQMGVAISDQFSLKYKLNDDERRLLILLGISAGFAAVFGTPIAAAIFAIELVYIKTIKPKWYFVVSSFVVAFLADFVCSAYGIHHTHYIIKSSFNYFSIDYVYVFLFGLIAALVAILFIQFGVLFQEIFYKFIAYAPLRTFVGGIILLIIVLVSKNTTYLGLGIETIQKSFLEPVNYYDFLLKILFTSFTLSVGFKGGEVTPLFFIGATLGNACALFLPLPFDVLAAMGFVAVFAASTNAPFACAIMGAELFGFTHFPYLLLVCGVAYYCSKTFGIYTAQYNVKKYSIFLKSK
ncbi:MAG: chloride channel protein [Sphingobacteriales bacterium]|nr:MAG: chloride channel protein [Sphingobacteriales bacterium]